MKLKGKRRVSRRRTVLAGAASYGSTFTDATISLVVGLSSSKCPLFQISVSGLVEFLALNALGFRDGVIIDNLRPLRVCDDSDISMA